MSKFNSQFEFYIQNAEDFSQPILNYLRELVHIACPEVDEKIKWSFPTFEYKGTNLCYMAAFKYHCAFGFWLSSKMEDNHQVFKKNDDKNSMGDFGKIQKINDLPDRDVLIEYIIQAMFLIEKGEKLEKTSGKSKPQLLEVPEEFKNALQQNQLAFNSFESFSISQKNDYLMWILEAKTESTRQKRIDTSIEWLNEGKIRNWKYLKK